MRIGISGYARFDQMVEYLERAHWKGDIAEFKQRCQFVDETCESFVLSLDLTDQLLPRVGIECQPGIENNRLKSTDFLARICEELNYATDRAEAVLSWIGRDELVLDSGVRMSSERWLSHIKLQYIPGEPVQTKTYLCYDADLVDA